jgi:hypothetical protein
MFGPASLVGGGLSSERERMAAQVFQPVYRSEVICHLPVHKKAFYFLYYASLLKCYNDCDVKLCYHETNAQKFHTDSWLKC